MTEQGAPFAIRLHRAMAELNISRLTLARELGVDKSVIARWLGGVNQPTSHNLTRLTDVVRKRCPDITLDFWHTAERSLLAGARAEPAVAPEPVADPAREPAATSPDLALSGLRSERRTEIDANYRGLWAGFYQSTQNRGAIVLCVMQLQAGSAGLHCVFSEGKVSAVGTAIAIGVRLHAILEIEPLHDRLCLFIFNGVGTPDAVVMDGIYAISAGDASANATASPIVLFRVGDDADVARAGGLDAVLQAAYRVNIRIIPAATEAADPTAGLAEEIPSQVLRLLCVQVGTPRADGELDHVLRMPTARSLPSGSFGLAELPPSSPIVATHAALRRMLGLG